MKKRIVGITGPSGFVAQHLRTRLSADESVEVRLIPRKAWEDKSELDRRTADCDAIVHLAAMNRGDADEVYQTNIALADKLAESLDRTGARPHVVFSSTTQRDNNSRYGASKLEAEDRLRAWSIRTQSPLTLMVIPNVYGAGCRPYYNSVVATFCHQLAHGETPEVHEDREVDFVWVGDLVDHIANFLDNPPEGRQLKYVPSGASLKVTRLLEMLGAFRDAYFDTCVVPDLSNKLDSTLYTTFLSHLDLDDHRHLPEVNADNRGELYEVIKLAAGGQVFFSTTKPGVIRGNHYHTRKIEWFCVLRGQAAIRLRPVHGTQVKEYRVGGGQPEFISIPVMHTHHIENTGSEELLTMFWCNEIFDSSDADTIYEPVEPPAISDRPSVLRKAS